MLCIVGEDENTVHEACRSATLVDDDDLSQASREPRSRMSKSLSSTTHPIFPAAALSFYLA